MIFIHNETGDIYEMWGKNPKEELITPSGDCLFSFEEAILMNPRPEHPLDVVRIADLTFIGFV